jgi:quinol monooxygenase YgiN
VSYVLLARWTAAPGNEERVEQILLALAVEARKEPGCRTFRPSRSVDDPRVFVIYEEYDDEAALEAHSASAHFKRYVLEEGVPLLESRERSFYRTLD